MSKNRKLSALILALVFVLFNVIAFAIPTIKTATVWTAYGFTVVAFALQLLVWKQAFDKTETLKSKFLGIPVVHVGIVYLAVQLLAFALFMAVPTLPAWSAVVACAVILAISAVCLIAFEPARDEINRVEEKVKAKVFYIQSLRVDVELLAEKEINTETKTALKNLAEKIRFSDPMSNEAFAELEQKNSDKISELKTATEKHSLIAEIELLLLERNKKCKLMK